MHLYNCSLLKIKTMATQKQILRKLETRLKKKAKKEAKKREREQIRKKIEAARKKLAR